jgi:UPF0755 protein
MKKQAWDMDRLPDASGGERCTTGSVNSTTESSPFPMAVRFAHKRMALLLFGVLFLMGVFLSVGFGYFLMTPAKSGGPQQVFFVREGQSLNEVAHELGKAGLIRSRSLFLIWSRAMGYSKRIKAGEYGLNSNMSPLKILDVLSKGLILTHAVTIPEGFTVNEIADLLSEKALADKGAFLAIATDPEAVKQYGLPGPDLEGYLYPDTYQFSRGLPAPALVEVMVKRFWEVVGPLKEAIDRSGLTLGEVITLASIVEKETGRAQERPLIASVFLNRLKKRMRLESDPTVIYGLEGFDGNLTRANLAKGTPYNTYLVQGLPPGPIANPGLDAIRAVLYPAKTDYLYFVSKNDGSHFFSRTLPEHNRAVAYYQKKKGQRPEETP